jgi:diphthine methyl ester synthase
MNFPLTFKKNFIWAEINISTMVLYVIGLGLGDERDITLRGLESVKKCSKLFLEYYTSILGIDNQKLSEFYGVPVVLADRNMVESEAEQIYKPALTENIGLLVVGDPLCATTHTDIILRARDLGIQVEIIHNTSVMGAIASSGLQLYRFGYTISIPYFEENWRPSSFYQRIHYNNLGGMHTCALLDIKVKEPNYEAMAMGKVKWMPPRFMSINTAIEQLLEVEEREGMGLAGPTTRAVGMARLGQPTQLIVYGTLAELRRVDFGPPLHTLALVCRDCPAGEGFGGPGSEAIVGLHPIEEDYLKHFSIAALGDRIAYLPDQAEEESNSADEADI